MSITRIKIVAWLLLFAVPSVSIGKEYYIAPGGSDNSQGVRERPFKTIQKAAEQVKPGDSCFIAPGMYRETVMPKNSGTKEKPIIFKAAKGGEVTIIGTDPVRGWAKHEGNIYKAKMQWSLGKNNQVFFDGKPMQEARWPNDKDGDPLTPDGAQIGGGDVDHIACPQFPADWKADDLKGAVVWAIPQSAWSSWTIPVSGYESEAKKVLFPSFKGDWWVEANHNPKSGKGTFYIVGALKLLDAPGEWFYDDAAKTLYFWAPENADPNKHAVEAKSRLLGADMKGKSWIVIDGINLLGCTLDLDGASYCVIKGIKARHISHTRGGKTTCNINEKTGIHITGHHNRLESCEISYSAGSGVELGGADNAIVNCWIHHISYLGSYCAPVSMSGMRHLVSHNTIIYAGRDCIKLGGAEHLIQFNDIGYAGLICHDMGCIYSGGLDGGNTRIRYNFVHGNTGMWGCGIYLDNYMCNYIIDHNVVWDVDTAIRLNRPTGYCMVLNNTTLLKEINNVYGPWKGQKTQWGCHVMNNLCVLPIKMNPEVVMRGNLVQKDIAGCFDIKTQTRGTANPGKGTGIPIAGITPKDQVDVGAFQYNQSPWRAGHDFKTQPAAVYTPANEPLRNYIRNAGFEYQGYHRRTPEKTDALMYWTKTQAATAEVEHHNGFNSPPAESRNSIHGNSVTLGGNGDNGIEQKISGLAPKTAYCFSGYAKHAEDSSVEFAVQLSKKVIAEKSSKTVKLENGQTWRFVDVRFETGPSDTSATVTIVKKGAGPAYVDDTGVVPTAYGLGESEDQPVKQKKQTKQKGVK